MNYSLHFRVDKETRQIIENLIGCLACSKGELARRAIKLFNQIYSEGKSGNDIVIRNRKGQKETSLLVA